MNLPLVRTGCGLPNTNVSTVTMNIIPVKLLLLQYRPSGKRDRKTKEKMARCSVKMEQANA
jgi:hypothetical protein